MYCTSTRLVLTCFLLSRSLADYSKIANWYNESGHIVTGVLGDEWIPITQSEALDYYTAHEVCTLTGVEQCDYEPGNLREYLANMGRFCRFTTGYFLRHKSTKPWPSTKGVADLVHLMFTRNSNSVIIVGDSVSLEHWHDALSAARRTSLDVTKYPSKQFKGFEYSASVSLPASILPDKPAMKSKLVYFHFVTMGHINSPDGFTIDQLKPDIDSYLKNPEFNTGKALFIINLGLHFQVEYPSTNLVGAFTDMMTTRFLPLFIDYAKNGHTVLYRETSAQHFRTETGTFRYAILEEHRPRQYNISSITTVLQQLFPDKDHPINSSVVINANSYPDLSFHCAPIKNITMMQSQNWQNPIVTDVLKKLDPSGNLISIIPFFNLTVGRHDFHVAKVHDCTHFCAGPLLWAPVWEQIVQFYSSKV